MLVRPPFRVADAVGFTIGNSALPDGITGYWTRTFAAGNTKKWSFIWWMKPTDIDTVGADINYLMAGTAVANYGRIWYDASTRTIQLYSRTSSTVRADIKWNPNFDDPTAHKQCQIDFDAVAGTATLSINGVEVTDKTVSTAVANVTHVINSAVTHYIGRHSFTAGEYANEYFSEVIFVNDDNPATTVTGEFDADNGEWKPKVIDLSAYSATNTCYLNMANSGDLGLDASTPGVGYSPTDAIPIMTSDTAPSGTASASTFATSYNPFNAMDSTPTNNGWITDSVTTGWLAYEFTSTKKVMRYSVGNGNVAARCPKDWTLEGWTGSAWEVVDTITGETGWGVETRYYLVDTPDDYIKYKIDVTANNGDGTYLEIDALELFDVADGINHWTVNGTITQSTDTPTNNNVTLSSIDNGGSVTLSEGNKKIVTTGSTTTNTFGTIALPPSGKVYFETTLDVTTSAAIGSIIGLAKTGVPASRTQAGATIADGISMYHANSGSVFEDTATLFNPAGVGTSGDIWQVAVDLDNSKIWFGVDDVWYDSAGGTTGNPSTGANPVSTKDLTEGYVPFAGNWNTQQTLAFAEAEWTYTAPTGFSALSTDNFPALGSVKSVDDVIAIATDTEANIEATLDALSSGWATKVRLMKNRDSAEDWPWQFDHDSGNEHAVDGTPVYQAKRTLAGADNWVGYDFHVGAAYGIAAGAEAHTNGGGDTTVTDNSGTTNKAILLFPRAGGDVYVHHPALTAGKLVKLNDAAAEATSARIKNITANSFDIESAAPTDTYDWLVFDGDSLFIDLEAHTGNGSVDGPVIHGNIKTRLWINRKFSTVTSAWYLVDAERDPDNPITQHIYPNLDNVEATSTDPLDIYASCSKIRTTAGQFNTSGASILNIRIGQPVGGSDVAEATGR